MPSSSNTFGTFLNTFSTLEKQRPSGASRSARMVPDLMIMLAKHIAEAGGALAVKDLVKSFRGKDSEILGTLLEGRSQSMFELDDLNGESIVRLTSLGRAFADR